MAEPEPQFLDIATPGSSGRTDRRRIVYLAEPGTSPSLPGLLWLQGFKSDMISTKATALSVWAHTRGQSLIRFDYSGHGQSATPDTGGRFEDGAIGRWLDETRNVFARLTNGPHIIIGSSMGGYLALLLLRRLQLEHPAEAARIHALVLIAPAWDMTETLMWQRFPADVRQQLMSTGVWLRPSQYGAAYPITRTLIEDGRRHLLPRHTWNPGRPVVILHGRLDPDVPFAHSEQLCSRLEGGWPRLVEVPDGEHRLSRPEDIALVFQLIEQVTPPLR